MPSLEIYYQCDPGNPGDDGWCSRIDGSTYEGGGHIPGAEDLGPDDLAEAVAAWLRSEQPIGAPCLACGAEGAETDQIVASMIGANASNEEIADAIGCTPNHVTKIARRLGLSRGRGRPPGVKTTQELPR